MMLTRLNNHKELYFLKLEQRLVEVDIQATLLLARVIADHTLDVYKRATHVLLPMLVLSWFLHTLWPVFILGLLVGGLALDGHRRVNSYLREARKLQEDLPFIEVPAKTLKL